MWLPGLPCRGLPVPARYAFTVVANITVYGAAWLLLHLQASPHVGPVQDVSDHLGVQDVPVFRVSGGWGQTLNVGPGL